MRFQPKIPDVRAIYAKEKAKLIRDRRQAALIATDRASKLAQRDIQQRMQAAGLGRLGNAVGQSSALKLRQKEGDPFGVIFARGDNNSRAEGALEAYSRGTTIRPTGQFGSKGEWLAFQTTAIPRRSGRNRMTPALYRKNGLEARLGKLQFIQTSQNRAVLVARKVSVGPKTGRISPRRKGSKKPGESVVVFILIRITRRAKRFDKDQLVQLRAMQVAEIMAEEMERLAA